MLIIWNDIKSLQIIFFTHCFFRSTLFLAKPLLIYLTQEFLQQRMFLNQFFSFLSMNQKIGSQSIKKVL